MKHLSKALFAAALFTAASAVHAQTVYYATGFENSEGYVNDTTDPNNTLHGQNGWTTTDTANAVSNPTGGLDQVHDSGAPFNNVGQLFGGLDATTFPSATTVSLGHALSQPTVLGYTFNTDFNIASSTNAHNNSYAFAFNNAAGVTVFSINFAAASTLNAAPQAQLVSPLGGTSTLNNGVTLDGYYHLTVAVSDTGTVTASFYGLAAATGMSDGSPVVPVAAATLVAGADAISSIAVTETANGGIAPNGITNGDDAITFDNIVVAVPEPSTYATLGLGLLGTVGMMKFRRRKA